MADEAIKTAKAASNEALQDTFDVSKAVTYTASPVASTDPFSGKGNAFAESPVVEVTTIGAGVHVVMGDSGVSAATTSDYLIPAGESRRFYVSADRPYMRIIQNAASATVFVTEVY